MSSPVEQPLVDRQQLSAYLGVSLSTIDRLVAKQRIPVVRITPRTLRFNRKAVYEALITR